MGYARHLVRMWENQELHGSTRIYLKNLRARNHLDKICETKI